MSEWEDCSTTSKELWYTAIKNQSGSSSSRCGSIPSSVDLEPICRTCLFCNFPPLSPSKLKKWSSWSCAYADQAARRDPATCFGMKLNLDSRLHLITHGDFHFHLSWTSPKSPAVLYQIPVWSFIWTGNSLNIQPTIHLLSWRERNHNRDLSTIFNVRTYTNHSNGIALNYWFLLCKFMLTRLTANN